MIIYDSLTEQILYNKSNNTHIDKSFQYQSNIFTSTVSEFSELLNGEQYQYIQYI